MNTYAPKHRSNLLPAYSGREATPAAYVPRHRAEVAHDDALSRRIEDQMNALVDDMERYAAQAGYIR